MEKLSLLEIEAALSDTKLGRKMHLLEGYEGESMEDLEHLKEDVYENFTSISKLHIAYVCNRKLKKVHIMRIIGLDLTFRLILKLCVEGPRGEKKVMINRNYLKILADLEIFICDSKPDIGDSWYKFGCLSPSLRRMVCEVLSNTTMPRASYIFDAVESVLQLARSNYCKIDDLPEADILLIKFLQFANDHWLTNKNYHEDLTELLMCIKDVLHIIMNKSIYFIYDEPNERDDSDIWKDILKVLILVESNSFTPPFTDELLTGYLDCIQCILTRMLKDKEIKKLMDPMKNDQLLILKQNLAFLVSFLLIYIDKEKLLDDDRIQLQAMARNIGYLIHPLLNSGTRGNMAREIGYRIYSFFNNGNMALGTNLVLPDLIEKVRHMPTHFKKILLRSIIEKYMQASPHTDPLGFLKFSLGNMKELIDCKSDTIMAWENQFQEIHEGLVFLSLFLQRVSITDDASQDLRKRIRIAAYESEYFINSFFLKTFPVTYRSSFLSDLTEEIDLIIPAVLDNMANTVSGINKKDTFSAVSASITDSTKDPIHNAETTDPRKDSMQIVDVVVGFDKEIEVITGQLTSISKERNVVSITGMPGLGKTTLARKVYDHAHIVNHFKYRAWCCVSQEYQKHETLLSILCCIGQSRDKICEKSEVELSLLLHKELSDRRYLIVMDDVWGMDAFEDLLLYFPDNRNGSRVVLTSRSKSIGSRATYHLELGSLNEEKSWDLLEQKVFQKQKCPLELYQVGQEIANKCRGLPLVIVVVAGILFKSDKKLEFWNQIARNISFHIALDSQQHWVAALDLSYEHLPEHLKPLFLYFGAFPEDKVISTETLKWLWVAEGFVHKTDGNKSLEDEAEINLMELTYRNLIMVAERRYDGRVQTVRIHDSLREMSIRKGEEQMFMQQIHVPLVCNLLPDPFYSYYRVCISLTANYTPTPSFVTYEDFQTFAMCPPLCSLLHLDTNTDLSWSEEAIKSIFRNFKMLRVLHFETIAEYGNLLTDTIVLVRLRYISIGIVQGKIPSSIASLVNLETLIVRSNKIVIAIEVPVEIWKMIKLRHIHISPFATFSDALYNTSKLENLQTLSTPVVYNGEEKNLFRRLPNVRELRCKLVQRISSKSWDPQLVSLDQLESLYLYSGVSKKVCGDLSLPSTLKELSLFGFRLQWNQISRFQNLPNLEALQLHERAVDGELWELRDDDMFPKLIVLMFDDLGIKEWIVSAENFPCLQKLVIHECEELEEIPSSIGEIESLLEIELKWCSESVKTSATQIQEYQKDFGNESLIVRIKN